MQVPKHGMLLSPASLAGCEALRRGLDMAATSAGSLQHAHLDGCLGYHRGGARQRVALLHQALLLEGRRPQVQLLLLPLQLLLLH